MINTMNEQNQIFAPLVKHENSIIENYRELSEQAAQSNIQYFLNLFIRGHQEIIRILRSYSKDGSKANFIKHEVPQAIEATQHLVLDEHIDVNSLQSVLLHIAKAEEQSVGEFSVLMEEINDSGAHEFLERIREEKVSMTTQADRLYHDMIESKIS